MDKFGVGKSILLAMPDWFLYKETKQKLEEFGFKVIGIPFPDYFKYKHLGDRAYNFIRKIFLRDKDYKAFLKYRDTGSHITKIIDDLSEKVDYALMIRADYYPLEIISRIKEKAHKLVGYQWDGLERFNPIFKLIPLFDRFFVFDPYDLSYSNVFPATNFYFDQKKTEPLSQDIDVYYLANFVRSRIKRIQSLSAYLKKIGSNSVIKLLYKKEKVVKKYKSDNYELISSYVSYEENLNYVRRARILIDFLHGVHYGLSFRVFEAIGSEKKLITDNKEIARYDFYDPQNIYIIKDDRYEGLEEFIHTPYKSLDPVIRHKYNFENWLRYVLDIQPYTPIGLPQ